MIPVDPAALEERAAALAKPSVKGPAKLAGLALAVRVMDLTTLEGRDTPGRVEQLCRKALLPIERDETFGPCAAVCVYPSLVPAARRALAGSPVKVASVATAFPSGQSPIDVKLADLRRAVDLGADEIDMVVDRGAILRGEHARAFDEIAAAREACGAARLKVILETGELGSYDVVRLAAGLAIAAGADFVKTSTGKTSPGATLPVALVLLHAVREHFWATGKRVGLKVAGGVRTSRQALQYLALVSATLGDAWLAPGLFRVGASALLSDVAMQIEKQRTGAYQAADAFSKD